MKTWHYSICSGTKQWHQKNRPTSSFCCSATAKRLTPPRQWLGIPAQWKSFEKVDFLSFLVVKWWAWTGMEHTAPPLIDPAKWWKHVHNLSILHQQMTSSQCIRKGASIWHQLWTTIAGDLRTKDLAYQSSTNKPSRLSGAKELQVFNQVIYI